MERGQSKFSQLEQVALMVAVLAASYTGTIKVTEPLVWT